MEYLPKQLTHWAIKKVSINLKGLIWKVISLATTELKLEINNNKIYGTPQRFGNLKKTLLNKLKVKKIIREIIKYFELNKNENASHQF